MKSIVFVLALVLGLVCGQEAAAAAARGEPAPIETAPTEPAPAQPAEAPTPKPATTPPLASRAGRVGSASTPLKVVAGARMRPSVALRAARPWSFTATAAPVALGAALSFKAEDAFSAPLFLLSLVVTLGVHAAGNLMNTLYDYEKGVDSPASSDTTLVDKVLQPAQVRRLIRGCYALAAAAALPLAALSRAALRPLGGALALGAASAYAYTGGPGLKYRALGDVLISMTFGPLLVGFSYLVQSGRVAAGPLLASLPLAAHVEAILHANNARDVAEDVANGVHTLASRLGPARSAQLYRALIALPFAAPLWGTARESALAALPLLAAPAGLKLLADYDGGRMAGLPARTAKFQLLFGALTVLQVVLGVTLPTPSLRTIVGWP